MNDLNYQPYVMDIFAPADSAIKWRRATMKGKGRAHDALREILTECNRLQVQMEGEPGNKHSGEVASIGDLASAALNEPDPIDDFVDVLRRCVEQMGRLNGCDVPREDHDGDVEECCGAAYADAEELIERYRKVE